MAMAMKGAMGVALAMVIALSIGLTVMAQGECSGNAPCPDEKNCCSKHGYCGTGEDYCGDGCKAGPCITPCPPPPSSGVLGDILTKDLYEQFFPNHNSFYDYDQLIESSKLFPQFGTTGDSDTRKREIAAYAAHVTHETSGLTEIVEKTNDDYCDHSREDEFPCNGNHFNGRGPLQLSWNYNYGTCGKYLNLSLLHNPDLVAKDPLISFKSSLWFWNEYHDDLIPRIHDVIIGNWKLKPTDYCANRVPGFGVTIDIINGGLECNKESAQADARVEHFKKFCDQLNVCPGGSLDCKNMKPFYSVKLDADS